MRIAITGSTGLVGSALIPRFLSKRHGVIEICRASSLAKSQTSSAQWDPDKGYIQAEKLEAQDVVIHLAGANISQPWTPAYKEIIKDSRVKSTRLISQTIAQLKKPPKVLLSASAVGFYGNRSPDDRVDEQSSGGQDFLAQVCNQWEQETLLAKEAGIRVVHLRFGVVLSPKGGALAKMLPIFKSGLGGVLGHGRQMMSWIALAEIPFIVEHIISHESISGAVNVVAPSPVSNREFTKALGKALHRPVIFPVPAFGIKMLFGEMGQTLLLEGVGVVPRRLLESGYVFKYPELAPVFKSEGIG